VLLDDELAAQRNHEEDPEDSAEKSEHEDARVFKREAEEDERRKSEDHTRGERFACRAGSLNDIIFENGAAAERAQDADAENGDGNRGRDSEPGAKADVDGDGSEKNTEEAAEDDGAQSEFGDGLFGLDEGLKFARRGG